jgi:hypothetical protein
MKKILGTRASLTLHHLKAHDIGASLVDELWSFMEQFVERKREEFEYTLRKCEEVTLIREESSGKLAGLFTAQTLEETREGSPVALIYYQWAFLAPRWRGHNIIHQLAISTYLRCRIRYPLRRLYGVAVMSSFKSYLLLCRSSRHFWPRRETQMPAAEAAMLDRAMGRLLGEDWDAQRGIERGLSRWRYREGIATAADLADPDVRAYTEWNPGQVQGDGLVCLYPMELGNWLFALYAAAQRPLRHARR